jgi:hypothetical protein
MCECRGGRIGCRGAEMPLGASGALIPVDVGAHGVGGCHTGSAALVSAKTSVDLLPSTSTITGSVDPAFSTLGLLMSATMLAHVTTAATGPKGGGYRAESPPQRPILHTRCPQRVHGRWITLPENEFAWACADALPAAIQRH